MVQQNMSKKPQQKQKRRRRKHSPEYKAEDVRLCRESGRTPEIIGREIGLSGSLVRNWVRQAEVDAGGGGKGPLTLLRAVRSLLDGSTRDDPTSE